MAHPTAGVPLVPPRGDDGIELMPPGVSPFDGGPAPVSSSVPQGSAAASDMQQPNVAAFGMDPQAYLAQQQSLAERQLLHGLTNADSRYGSTLPTLTTNDFLQESQAHFASPVLYSSSDDINHMRIKVIVQEIDERDLMIQKPVTKKGARLLQMEQREKRRIIEDLQRLRVEQEEQLRKNSDGNFVFDEYSSEGDGLSRGGASVDRYAAEMAALEKRMQLLSSSLSTQQYGSSLNKNPVPDSIVNDLLHLQSRHPVFSTTIKWQEKIFSPRELLFLSGYEGRLLSQSPQLRTYQSEIRAYLQQQQSPGASLDASAAGVRGASGGGGGGGGEGGEALSAREYLWRAKEVVAAFGNLRICTKVDADNYHGGEYQRPLTSSRDQSTNPLAAKLQLHQYYNPDTDHTDAADVYGLDKAMRAQQERARVRRGEQRVEMLDGGGGPGALVAGGSHRHEELDYSVMYVTVHASDAHVEVADVGADGQAQDLSGAGAGAGAGALSVGGLHKPRMALNPHSQLSRLQDAREAAKYGSEHVICRIRCYRNNTFDVLPCFSDADAGAAADAGTGDPLQMLGVAHVLDPTQWYYFSLAGKNYRFRIELVSRPTSVMQLLHKEQELLSVLFRYRQLGRAGQLGDAGGDERRAVEASVRELLVAVARLRAVRERMVEQQQPTVPSPPHMTLTPPPPAATQLCVFGDLSHLSGFEHSQLYVEYALQLPPGWAWNTQSSAPRLAATTHTSRGYYGPAPAHMAIDRSPASGPSADAARAFHHPSQPLPGTRADAAAYAVDEPYASTPALMSREEDDTAHLDIDGDGDYRDMHVQQGGWLCCAGERDRQMVHLLGFPLEFDLLCLQDRDALFTPREQTETGEPVALPGVHARAQSVYDRLFGAPAAADGDNKTIAPLTPLQSAPLLCMTVFATDWTHRHTPLAHAFVHVPTQPGAHTLSVAGWRVLPSLWEQVQSAFVGGGARVAKLGWVGVPTVEEMVDLDMTHAPGGWVLGRDDDAEEEGLGASEDEDVRGVLGMVREEDEEAEEEEEEKGGVLRYRGSARTSAGMGTDRSGRGSERAPLLRAPARATDSARDDPLRHKHYQDAIRMAQSSSLDVNHMYGHPLSMFYNRYGLHTENSGSVTLNLNVCLCRVEEPRAGAAATRMGATVGGGRAGEGKKPKQTGAKWRRELGMELNTETPK